MCKGDILWVFGLKTDSGPLCGKRKVGDGGERKLCDSDVYVSTCLPSLKFQVSSQNLAYVVRRCVKNTFYGFWP